MPYIHLEIRLKFKDLFILDFYGCAKFDIANQEQEAWFHLQYYSIY